MSQNCVIEELNEDENKGKNGINNLNDLNGHMEGMSMNENHKHSNVMGKEWVSYWKSSAIEVLF